MTAGSGIRIGDADREATATSLREHFSHGRLTMEEFQERLDATFAAKTDVDLAKVTEDLPQANPYAAPWPPQPGSPRPWSSRPWPSPPGTFGIPGPGRSGGSWSRPGRGTAFGGARAWLRISSVLVVLGVILVGVSVSPLAFGPRLLLVVLAVLAFVRRIFRWVGGRRRW
ncbi:MAG TPA: DUF1707 domain-containing protein [Streptosporangiaceae bacterium]|nr:DUF1707 domain-containing protein [Streptosporangiaceae bacterium]